MNFKDHFSRHAGTYAAARPRYPAALHDWLAVQCERRELAWDAGCGNGQATLALAPHFRRVLGTDPSAAQIAQAEPASNVEYRVEAAEAPSLEDASVDLVTVAQALHWFDQDRFAAAVQRVLRPGGVIAAWTYGLTHVDAAVDRVFMRLYDDILGAYWPPERRHVEAGYATLPFPFEPIEAPGFEMRCDWSLAQYLAYLRSWSATQRYLRERGEDPLARVETEFERAWGDAQRVRAVRWPLGVRVGRR
jgi:SAM-dependent methyltransferase